VNSKIVAARTAELIGPVERERTIGGRKRGVAAPDGVFQPLAEVCVLVV
jgi:hypothetical protein